MRTYHNKSCIYTFVFVLLFSVLSCNGKSEPEENKNTDNHTTEINTDNNQTNTNEQNSEEIPTNSEETAINSEYSLPPETKYITKRNDEYLYNKLFFIGWSEDGKIAYAVEPADEASGLYFFEVIIQDMVSDKIVWKWELPETDQGSPQSVWKENKDLFSKNLSKYAIEQESNKKLSGSMFLAHDNNYEIEVSTKTEINPDFGFEVISESQVWIISKNKGKKSIFESKAEEYSMTIGTFAPGCFISPYQNRIAVLLADERWGYEGPPNVISFKFIGSNLEKGFKPQS